MSEIEALLDKDEEILWKKSEQCNVIAGFFFFQIFFLFCGILLVFLSIFFFHVIMSDLRGILFILGGPLLLIISFQFRKFIIEIQKKLKMSKSELKNYNQIIILTNKRLFQRSYRNFFFFEKDFYDKNQIQVEEHAIYFNLKQIQAIFFEIGKKSKKFNELAFFLDFDFSYFKAPFRKATPASLTLKKEELFKVKTILDGLLKNYQKVSDLFKNQFYFSSNIKIPEESFIELKFEYI